MSITFTTVRPRRLISVGARLGNSGNWTTIPHCEAAAWRPATILATDYDLIPTTGNMKLYKPVGTPRGFGRTVVGVFWTRDPHAIEELVNQTHLNSDFNAVPELNTALSLQYVFNTGLNTNNFRMCYKVFQPIFAGVGWNGPDWLMTLKGPDSGKRGLFPCPWQLALALNNTSFNATNSTCGIVTWYAN